MYVFVVIVFLAEYFVVVLKEIENKCLCLLLLFFLFERTCVKFYVNLAESFGDKNATKQKI